MKKIIAIIFCAVIMMCAVSFAVSAEGSAFDSDIQSEVSPENPTVSEEIVTEGEILGATAPIESEAAPKDTTAAPNENPTPDETITGSIVNYIKAHFEEISVIVTLILTVFYQVRKHISLNKSIGVLNNNAIVVAESSNKAMNDALEEVRSMGSVVNGYKEDIASLLAEIRKNAEDTKRLENALYGANEYMKKAKEANIEFSNELAELLVLANIPNSKKDELYSRHRAAIDALDAPEVNDNDGKEA